MSSAIVERVAEKLALRKKRLEKVTLNQNNTYIFPTAHGFGFLLLLLLMLVAAINYQNSLIYICVFFLGSVFFVSIWMCFLNVSGLEVFSSTSEGVFEGEGASYRVGVQRKNSPVFGLRIGISIADMENLSLSEGELVFHEITQLGLKRGRHKCPKIRIESTYPFGFIRAWTWILLEADSVVYPRPEHSVICSKDQFELGKERQTVDRTERDSLREYNEGEPLNRISWKKYASTDQLFVLNDDKISFNPVIVNWDDYDTSGKEARLRYMCFRVCELYESGGPFGLVLPTKTILPNYSKKQLDICLSALAEY